MGDFSTRKAFLMFDLDACRDHVEDLRKQHILSRTELAKEIGISYATMQRFMDKDIKTVFSYKTLKKIRKFIERWEKK